jgi:hypothetical protein
MGASMNITKRKESEQGRRWGREEKGEESGRRRAGGIGGRRQRRRGSQSKIQRAQRDKNKNHCVVIQELPCFLAHHNIPQCYLASGSQAQLSLQLPAPTATAQLK